MKIRRGIIGTDPITAKYDALLDYDPLVLLPMEGAAYTEYRGQQLFFQDPAGTIPAVDVGDPVGGGLDLVSGEYLATQGTDADRPVLGADAVLFTGTEFLAIGEIGDFDYLHQVNPVGATLICEVVDDNIGTDALSVWLSTSFSLSEPGVSLTYDNRSGLGSPDEFRFYHSVGTGSQYSSEITLPNHGFVAGQRHIIAVSYTSTSYYIAVDGSEIASGAWAPTETTESAAQKLNFGRSPSAGGIGYFRGKVRTSIMSNRAFSSDEITTISETLL